METRLNIVKAQITPSSSINTVQFFTKSYSLHTSMRPLAKLLIWLFQCDSNNGTSTIVPQDIEEGWAQWEYYKKKYKTAMANKKQATASRELSWILLLPDTKEMIKFTNPLIETVGMQIYNHLRVSLSLDASKTQAYAKPADQLIMDGCNTVTEGILTEYFGVVGTDGKFLKHGTDVPTLSALGDIKPDLDKDYLVMNDPTKEPPKVGLDPDVKPV